MRSALLVLAVMICSSMAMADYCSVCKEMMRDASIGRCENCGQEKTTSRANKLCPACSDKLHECESCRAKLGKATTRPAR